MEQKMERVEVELTEVGEPLVLINDFSWKLTNGGKCIGCWIADERGPENCGNFCRNLH